MLKRGERKEERNMCLSIVDVSEASNVELCRILENQTGRNVCIREVDFKEGCVCVYVCVCVPG